MLFQNVLLLLRMLLEKKNLLLEFLYVIRFLRKKLFVSFAHLQGRISQNLHYYTEVISF